jgi:glutathione S-transferase
MAKIVLHQWEMSPFCNKIRRSLRFKGLEFEVMNYNGLKATGAAKLSRAGTLPVLDYDGERVADSVNIARFLDRKQPTPALYPTDPEELAHARFWEDWAGESLHFYEIYYRMLDPEALERALDLICAGRPGYERALLKVAFKRRFPKRLDWQGLGRFSKEEIHQKFVEHLDGLEAIVGKRRFLAGAAPTIADISVAAQLDEIVRTSSIKDVIVGRATLRDWMARVPTG